MFEQPRLDEGGVGGILFWRGYNLTNLAQDEDRQLGTTGNSIEKGNERPLSCY